MTNRLIHGDCLNVMRAFTTGSVDFILTDPPYLAKYVSRDGRSVPNDDNDRWLKPAFAEMFRVLKDGAFCVTFYGWPHADKFLTAYREAGFRLVGHFVFPKRYASKTQMVRYQHECAHLLAKGTPWVRDNAISDVIEWSYSGNKLHPTQKPLPVLSKLIEAFSSTGDLVIDPFAGSGSTLVAASMLGRRWLGIELDAEYYALASRRLSVAMGSNEIPPGFPVRPSQDMRVG
jgi:DNA modification methylase